MRVPLFLTLAVFLSYSPCALAEESVPVGQVQIPIEIYNQLVDAARSPTRDPRPAPARYALGNAAVTLTVNSAANRASAEVRVQLAIEILEDDWVLVPVLPAGTPIDAVTVNGQAVQLVSTPAGLGWVTQKKGSYSMNLSYRVDALGTKDGYALALPLPEAAAIRLTGTLPGTGLDASVIPAAGTRVTPAGSQTRIEATVPTTRGVQVSWRVPAARGHVLSRAHYTGTLRGGAIVWTAELGLELFSDETATLPLLPRSVPLDTLLVDDRQAPVLLEGDLFATLVKGVGRHTVKIGFQTPVILSDGPPRANLSVPQIPISRFDISLPGRKELSVSPQANVTSAFKGGQTVATVHAPLTSQLTFSWSEAVPDEVRAEVRSNATLYHAVHAEEGVLYVHALVAYEISRGSTNRLELIAPGDVQINHISSPSGAVADWRIAPGKGGVQVATVFLNRAAQGELRLDVQYDRALGPVEDGVTLPLLRAEGAQRQRGMLALLASQDLTLDPGDDPAATRVGENQLPAFVRDAIDKTIAHTFKYVEQPERFIVQARVPDPVRGRFDVQVDTLVSLGDVAVSGSTTAELNVKSGGIAALQIALPAGVNLLSLSAPSLRTHEVDTSGDRGIVNVEFTQEMEGQFRVELVYERILGEAQGDVEIPRPRVLGAEVEQGRIAVEALSAVEVQPASVEHLTPLDIAELPQQLILRTTNPILMAFKYLHAEPAPRLALTLTRHRTASVQEATIDKAEYRTLFTRDGLSVTTAEFLVRNSRKQFLRLRLPEDSEVWSVFVDGRAEKPALPDADENGAGRTVLVKMVHSTEGFPVRIVYATQAPAFGALGVARGTLPHPDVLVTSTRWDVYLPDGMRYRTPDTSMSAVTSGEVVSQEAMRAELMGRQTAQDQSLQPLRIDVPTAGVHYAFEKLYANQSEREVGFSLPYASGAGSVAGPLVSALGAALVWIGLGLYFWRESPVPSRLALAVAAAGGFIVMMATGLYQVSLVAPILMSVFLAGVALFVRRTLIQRASELT